MVVVVVVVVVVVGALVVVSVFTRCRFFSVSCFVISPVAGNSWVDIGLRTFGRIYLCCSSATPRQVLVGSFC